MYALPPAIFVDMTGGWEQVQFQRSQSQGIELLIVVRVYLLLMADA